MSLANILIPWTVALYLGFFVIYGTTVFDTDFAPDETSSGFIDGLLDFFDTTLDFVGDLGQFITLGGADSPLSPVVQAVFLLSIGLGWLLVLIGFARSVAL